MRARMQLLEVVTGHSQFLSHFSVPQAMPTQPVSLSSLVRLGATRPSVATDAIAGDDGGEQVRRGAEGRGAGRELQGASGLPLQGGGFVWRVHVLLL